MLEILIHNELCNLFLGLMDIKGTAAIDITEELEEFFY